MKQKYTLVRMVMLLALLVAGLTVAAVPGSAQFELPPGATFNSATLSVYANFARGWAIDVHRVTAPWEEGVVTWNTFGGAYDPIVAASFAPLAAGWNSVDVTGLVGQWLNGTCPNYGFLLRADTLYQTFYSSEWAELALRPKLQICYTPLGGSLTCVDLQRPAAVVADTDIYENNADMNYGAAPVLYAGILGGYQKQSLLWFELPYMPTGDGCTPGYWKNHLESWAATGYAPGDDFDTVFGTNYFNPDITLLQAVNLGGGGLNVLARHGTAALLSAAHPDVDYPYTVAEVIDFVQAGDVDPLVAANELGCPLD